jgi:putative ABC transport system permease protein
VYKFVEGLRIAVSSIVINRMRAALTMLGIVIGVAAVISLISLGRGVEGWVEEEFNSLGANMLIVNPSVPESDERTRIEPFSTADVEALLQVGTAPSIEDIASQYNVAGFVSDDGESMRTAIRGVTANYDTIRNWDMHYGNFITQQQIDDVAKVAIIGTDVVEELYNDDTYDPTGETIILNEQSFVVIGVMESRDEPFNNDNGSVLVPITTAQTRLASANVRGGLEVSILYVRATNKDTTFSAEEEIDAYFYDAHDIKEEDQRDYAITNMGDNLEIAGQITAMLTVFLGMIAGVSLLVGGIGIMNIMLVTVTERTKEIGLRKAMGAEPTDILLQFLLESTTLSLIGGAIGVGIGWLFAQAGTSIISALTLSVDLDAVLVATIVSSLVGIGFGAFPAWQAARMHPIDALNFE